MSDRTGYAFGEFVLDTAQSRLLRREGAPVELTPRLFAALLVLVERAGELVDRETLHDLIWPGLVVGDNSVSQAIAGLRRILDDDAHGGRYIQTVPRKGFRFVAAVTRTARARLAVLPFRAVGSQDRVDMLDVGMADSLIARLSVLPGIVVLAPGSVGRFGGSDRDPLRAARELDAHWVVDGSVQRSGGRLRVVAQLLRAPEGVATWADVIDRDESGLFEIQDLLAKGVAQALTGTTLTLEGVAQVEPNGTRNEEARQLYLSAAWRAQGGRSEDIDRGIALVERALAIDPDHARAWALLAWVHRRRLWNVDALPRDVFARSDYSVQRALALAPGLALAHAGVGFSRFLHAYDWSGAEGAFRVALEANPSEANARWGLAFLLLTQGRVDEGFAHLRVTREVDPLSPIWHTLEAGFLISAGNHAEAHRRVEVALDISPGLWLAHAALGLLLLAENKKEAGVAELRRAVELGPDTVRPKAHLAVHLAADGDHAAARGLLSEIRQRAERVHVPPTSLAMIHAALGESKAALDELDRAFELRDTRLVELKGDPSWQPIRKEPRFVALMRRLGLEEVGPGLMSV